MSIMKGEMKMKLFEMPYVEVVKFAVADVITTSGEPEEVPIYPCV